MLTAGTMLLVWLGEQITERGIGNGVSLVITIGILARLPSTASAVYYMFFPPTGQGGKTIFHALALILLLVGVVAAVIAVTQAHGRSRCNTRSGRSDERSFRVARRSCLFA